MFKKVDITDGAIRVMLDHLDFLIEGERRSYESMRAYMQDHVFVMSCSEINYTFARDLADAHNRYKAFLSTSILIVRELYDKMEDFRSTNINIDENGKHYLEEWEDEG